MPHSLAFSSRERLHSENKFENRLKLKIFCRSCVIMAVIQPFLCCCVLFLFFFVVVVLNFHIHTVQPTILMTDYCFDDRCG